MGQSERRSGVERRAAETKEELLRRIADLTAAGQRKDDFLAILSHELRNPIHAIRTNAWLLARAKDAEVRESSAAIDRQVSLLSNLLEDLLNVISLSRKTPLDLGIHDARELLRHAVDATRQSIEKRHHRLIVDAGPEALPVHVD